MQLSQRSPEPEWMDLPEEALAYAAADFRDVNAAFVERLMEVAGGTEVCSAVDLGTGPADIPTLLLTLRPGWRVVAIDASRAMLRHRALPSPPNMVCVQANAKCLPLGDQCMDGIFSNSILHHMPDPLPLWREVRRVVAKGGWIFFRDLARPATELEARAIVTTYAGTESALLQEEYYRSLLAAFTPAEVQEQLVSCGLGTLQVAKVTDRHMDIWGTV
ncbi:MAG: hypothetical protein AMXMBFR84_24320 [Candidatus Hydrogenedentota bacterium]